MINFKNNFKTISLTDDQFLLIKQIANLGFVTKPQLEMIYSIIKNKPTSISNHILNKLVNKDKVLNRIKSNESQNRIKQIAYVISRYGRILLSAYHCFYRDPRSFGINFHNLQANEVVIQALYASNFKPTALGSNNSSLRFNDEEKTVSITNSFGSTFTLPTFDVPFHDKKVSKPVVSRLKEDYFIKNADLARLPELLTEGLLVGGITDKKLRLSLDSKAQSTFLLKKGNEDDDWFVQNFSFLKNPRLLRYISFFKPFLPKKLIEEMQSYQGLTKTSGLRGRGAHVKLVKISNFYQQLLKSSNYYYFLLNLYQQLLNITNKKQLLATVGNYWQQLATVNNNYQELVTFTNSTLKKDTLDKNLAIIKPIGLLPFRVGSDFDDRVQRASLALRGFNYHLKLTEFDTRPFNAQLGITPTKKDNTAFEADTMITFKRNNKVQSVFIELDNRTEGSATQAQKILNYIEYANQHPNDNILLAIVSADGSLPTNKLKQYTYPDQHLGVLVDKMLRIRVGEGQQTEDGRLVEATPYLIELYERCPNLKIIFAGLSEAPMRIAEFIVNANHNMDYISSAFVLARSISKETQWDVTFDPTIEVKEAIKNTPALVDTTYNQLHYNVSGIYGYFNYSNKQTNLHVRQPVIAGDEYDLDTPYLVTEVTQNFGKHHVLKDGDSIPPMVIFPTRERLTHANVPPAIQKMCNWSPKFIVGQIYYYQPRLGIDNNPYLLRELRNLVIRHSKDIYQYYSKGFLSRKELAQGITYGDKDKKLPFAYADHILQKTRKDNELHRLTNYMNDKAFAEQIMLNEIPLKMLKSLIARTQGQAFSIPVIADLPYSIVGDDSLIVPDHISLLDCLTTPNTRYRRSDAKIDLKYSY
ncbi:hypothetical protein [Lactobacillus gallinarum]|uniref:hypothetical protein n=1 Tax=Lactobacillus gallinarum TaxID=52242 RepID=UPI001EF6323E|nr:hypothetical protein [Lactobacillus gallinarum]